MSNKKHAEKKRAHRKGDGKHQSESPKPDVTRLPMAAPNMRIGLLGGSFNPPHDAHRAISLTALKRLGLDQVWWLVTPGNPLKDATRLPSLASRIEAARDLARHPRIAVSGFEAGSGSAYTVDLIAELKRRFDVNDSCHLIPGHAGLLDRLDGFVAAILVAWLIGFLRHGVHSAGSGLMVW